jgi:tetratricopeptide (TPR) repeat protein
MTQPEETIRDDQRTWAESLESAARYFTDTDGGAFRFAVTSDELVQRRFNAELQQVLRGKETPVQIHDWSKASPPDMYPAEQLRRLKAARPETKGIICIGLERAMRESPEMLTLLNFAREALSDVGVPILFWISFRTLPLMSRFAIDLYNQRIGANLYFEHDAESADTDGLAMRFIAHETVKANQDLRPLEARLKLLEKQFDELKKIESPEKLANDIVLELLRVYVQISGMNRMVQSLIDEYGMLIDLEKPGNCFALAQVYHYLGDLQKAKDYYKRSLSKSIEIGDKYRESMTLYELGKVAALLDRLEEAECYYKEALNVSVELNDRYKKSMVLYELGKIAAATGRMEEAESCYKEALSILIEFNDRYRESMTLCELGKVLSATGRMEEAESYYKEALSILIEFNDRYNQAIVLYELGKVAVDMKRYKEAELYAEKALELHRELFSDKSNVNIPEQGMALTDPDEFIANLNISQPETPAAESSSAEHE